MRQWIAYEGEEFTIEWYYNEKGNSEVLEYFQQQPKEKQRKLLNLLRLLGDQGKIFDKTKFRYEEDGIYAFKPQPDRYLCFFFKGKKVIITNAFTKKTEKLPKGEKDRALKLKENFESRMKEGVYYEEKK